MATILHRLQCVNTLRPRQNVRHFADDTFNNIFVNENIRISIEFSLKFVPKGSINNIPALVQIMAWRRWGDKPLSEPMMVRLPTHICVTRPQWVKSYVAIGYVRARHPELIFSANNFNVWENQFSHSVCPIILHLYHFGQNKHDKDKTNLRKNILRNSE